MSSPLSRASADRRGLLTDANHVVFGIGERYYLLNIDNRLVGVGVRLHAHAANIKVALIQPEDRSRELLTEVGRNENDSDIPRKLVFARLIPP